MARLYLVTGACGHLGNILVRKLTERGETVRCLALPSESIESIHDLPAEICRGDVCDIDSLEPFFRVAASDDVIVIHAAGIVSIASRHQKKVYEVNTGGTSNMIRMCLLHKVSRLVYISSVHAIPENRTAQVISEISDFSPDKVEGIYAKSKAEATRLVLESVREGLNVVVVQPSGIVGPGDFGHGHVTQLFLDYLERRFKAIIEGGYDFVDVRDVADGVIAAAEKGLCGECYILGNRYVTVKEFLQILSEASGKPPIRWVLPGIFAKITAPLSEIYYKVLKQPPLYTPYSLAVLCSNARFSHEKAERELGFHPRAFRETVVDTYQWLLSQGRVHK
jgi:dihydroflavonol-4-reductase